MIDIPIVDMAQLDSGRALAAGLEQLGFVQLVGHGLDTDAELQLRECYDHFFALPESVKQRYVHPDPAANRGYRALGSEALSYSIGDPSPPDLFESFNSGADRRVDGTTFLQRTPWPDAEVPVFSDAVHAYIDEMERIAGELDCILGAAMGLGEEWLGSRSLAGPDMLAGIHYTGNADRGEPPLPGQLRMGAHSDYTSFTILNADPVPGLQILGPRNEWIDVTPDDGALLLNTGDILAMFTNDIWPSTLHRVVPVAAGAAPHRRSIAYFHYPDLDVEVAPLECTSHARTRGPVTSR